MTYTMESGAFLRWVLRVVFTAAALPLTLILFKGMAVALTNTARRAVVGSPSKAVCCNL